MNIISKAEVVRLTKRQDILPDGGDVVADLTSQDEPFHGSLHADSFAQLSDLLCFVHVLLPLLETFLRQTQAVRS